MPPELAYSLIVELLAFSGVALLGLVLMLVTGPDPASSESPAPAFVAPAWEWPLRPPWLMGQPA